MDVEYDSRAQEEEQSLPHHGHIGSYVDVARHLMHSWRRLTDPGIRHESQRDIRIIGRSETCQCGRCLHHIQGWAREGQVRKESKASNENGCRTKNMSHSEHNSLPSSQDPRRKDVQHSEKINLSNRERPAYSLDVHPAELGRPHGAIRKTEIFRRPWKEA